MGIISPKKLQKNLKLEVPKLGEVRVEARYIDLKPKKERVTKGIVIEVSAEEAALLAESNGYIHLFIHSWTG